MQRPRGLITLLTIGSFLGNYSTEQEATLNSLTQQHVAKHSGSGHDTPVRLNAAVHFDTVRRVCPLRPGFHGAMFSGAEVPSNGHSG